MNPIFSLGISGCFAGAALMLATVAVAQQRPGEDPLVLNKKTVYEALPTAAPARSGSLDPTGDMPAWLRARVARYEAKAYSGVDDGSVLTNNDAVTSASAQGLKKACVQEVGSSTSSSSGGFNQYGPKGTPQVVVLKGDLVNVCK